MNQHLEELPEWAEFQSYLSASKAEFDAAYLSSEGIPARVTAHTILPGQPGRAILWVNPAQHERATWLLKVPPVTEAELEFLATGRLPNSERQE